MQPLRILIVDNAISHRKVMRAAMEEVLAALPGGGITEFATTAEETHLLLPAFQPNAITVNFAMSILRIDDTPFVPWLVRTARVPTIAYGLSDVLRDAALATGVDAYFMRPTQRSDWPPFCSKIARFLRRLAFPDEPPIYAPSHRPKSAAVPPHGAPAPQPPRQTAPTAPAASAASRAQQPTPSARSDAPTSAPPIAPLTPAAAAVPQRPAPPAAPATPSAAAPSGKPTPPAAEPLVRAVVPSSLRRKATPSKEDELFAMLARTAHTHAAPAPPAAAPPLPAEIRPAAGIKLIAIGASTGGTDAIADVLHRLQPPLPPIVIVQHIPAYFSRLFAIRLNEECTLPVNEGEDGLVLEPSHAYIAPGDYHMAVCRQGDELALHCFHGPKIHSVRPAVDVLFGSVVKVLGADVLGVLLTGMGKDGADGLLRLRQAGAPTIGQDRETCVVYGMPRIAQERGALLYQLPLPQIGPAIQKIAGARY